MQVYPFPDKFQFFNTLKKINELKKFKILIF